MRRILVLALLFLTANAFAQRKSPVVSPAKIEPARELPPGYLAQLARPPAYSIGDLTLAERSLLAMPGRVPRIGVHRQIGPQPMSNGTWQALPDGSPVWRMQIHSTGASGIRVQFGNFSTGAGKVWVYGEDGKSQGPYTGKGIFGNGEFWSGTIFAESATVEYQPGDATDRTIPFEIRSIAHRVTAQARRAITRNIGTAVSDPAAACNLDASCYPDWSDAMKMVSEMIFETEENGQAFEAACSGSLVGTRDNSFKPYLMTAGHCIHNEPDARTLETFWTYQTSKCGGAAPLLSDSTTSQVGADYLASGSLADGDYSLVLLKNVPSGVLYSGWDTSDVALGGNVVGVHHPMASWKRILFGHRAPDELVLLDGYNLPADLYYIVTLDNGIAQQGSSGSALFTSPGVIVGTLTWGPAADGETLCALKSFDIGYGRFSAAYPNLINWLEDLPSAEVLPASADLNFTDVDGVIAGGSKQTVNLTTLSVNPVNFSVRSDSPWIQVGAATLTVSASKPAPITISINPEMLPEAGSYTGTVTILSGAAAPQFVNVHVQVKMDISNVSASVSPNPVHQGSNGLWAYTIELQENAGAATQLTLLRIDGRDYSSQIVKWFGSDQLSAGGNLEASLKSRVLAVPATQTIEVGGIDAGSHKSWYRVLTVSLLAAQ